MYRTNVLWIAAVSLTLSACCGGEKKEPSRWDPDNKNKPPSATATATATSRPTAPATTNKPTPPTPTPTPTAEAKADCKKPGTGAMNKAFPADNTDGFKRIYKTDKDDLAEAEYTKGKEKLVLAIKFDPSRKGEYGSVSDKVAGFPYKPFGKNKSNIFVKDCYLVSASSQEVAEDARKTWLGKFNFSALP
jgi:hypothetical protein